MKPLENFSGNWNILKCWFRQQKVVCWTWKLNSWKFTFKGSKLLKVSPPRNFLHSMVILHQFPGDKFHNHIPGQKCFRDFRDQFGLQSDLLKIVFPVSVPSKTHRNIVLPWASELSGFKISQQNKFHLRLKHISTPKKLINWIIINFSDCWWTLTLIRPESLSSVIKLNGRLTATLTSPLVRISTCFHPTTFSSSVSFCFVSNDKRFGERNKSLQLWIYFLIENDTAL